VDAPGSDGNESMPEQVKRPNPWRKMMMMMIYMHFVCVCVCVYSPVCVCVCVYIALICMHDYINNMRLYF